jgi:hypothetical protein
LEIVTGKLERGGMVSQRNRKSQTKGNAGLGKVEFTMGLTTMLAIGKHSHWEWKGSGRMCKPHLPINVKQQKRNGQKEAAELRKRRQRGKLSNFPQSRRPPTARIEGAYHQ